MYILGNMICIFTFTSLLGVAAHGGAHKNSPTYSPRPTLMAWLEHIQNTTIFRDLVLQATPDVQHMVMTHEPGKGKYTLFVPQDCALTLDKNRLIALTPAEKSQFIKQYIVGGIFEKRDFMHHRGLHLTSLAGTPLHITAHKKKLRESKKHSFDTDPRRCPHPAITTHRVAAHDLVINNTAKILTHKHASNGRLYIINNQLVPSGQQ